MVLDCRYKKIIIISTDIIQYLSSSSIIVSKKFDLIEYHVDHLATRRFTLFCKYNL